MPDGAVVPSSFEQPPRREVQLLRTELADAVLGDVHGFCVGEERAVRDVQALRQHLRLEPTLRAVPDQGELACAGLGLDKVQKTDVSPTLHIASTRI